METSVLAYIYIKYECRSIYAHVRRVTRRKPGPQHHIGLDATNPDVVACEQQRRSSVCASAFIIRYLKSKVTTIGSDILNSQKQFGELQHDRASVYAPVCEQYRTLMCWSAFARILFLRIALKGKIETFKIRDWGVIYLYQ